MNDLIYRLYKVISIRLLNLYNKKLKWGVYKRREYVSCFLCSCAPGAGKHKMQNVLQVGGLGGICSGVLLRVVSAHYTGFATGYMSIK